VHEHGGKQAYAEAVVGAEGGEMGECVHVYWEIISLVLDLILDVGDEGEFELFVLSCGPSG